MKRLVIGIVAVAAMTLSLAACSSATNSSSGGKPTLLLWVDTPRVPQAEMYQKLMAGKETIKIEVIAQADAQTKIALHNRTKSGWPDVIFGAAADTAQFLDPSNGYAADLTNLVSKKVFDGFGEGNSDCKFDGKYYCLKNDLANTVLWYNTKIFKDLNLTVPTTMQEFADTAMKLKGTGYSAGAIGDQNYYASFLQSSECPLAAVPTKNTVRIAPNDPKCTRVAQLVQPLLDAGVVDKRSSFDAGFIADVAKKDKVAMTLGPSWFGDFVIKPADSWGVPAGEIADAPMPAWGTGSDNKSGAYGGGVFTVSAHSKFPQAAADAAVWLTTSDAMATATTTPTFPAYGPANKLWEKRISADPYYASNPYPAMAAGANNISQVDRPVRFAFVAQIGTVLQADINGGKSLKTALDDYATSLQKLAPSSGYKVLTK
jgi:multiple sugar transport system substrate-binding protein